MACCVVMAALLGCLALIKALPGLAPRQRDSAQQWRLEQQKDAHE